MQDKKMAVVWRAAVSIKRTVRQKTQGGNFYLRPTLWKDCVTKKKIDPVDWEREREKKKINENYLYQLNRTDIGYF